MKLKAQQNFQKIYIFQDTFAIFNDIYVTDSCYYYTCTSGKAYQREFFNFGKIHLDGTEEVLLLDQDNTSLQRVMFSKADMDTNFTGNFVTCFTNSSIQGTVPRVKEFNINGSIVNDFTFNDYWLNDSLFFFPLSRIIMNNADSSYLLFYHRYDYTTDDNSGTNGSTGTILVKLKYDGTIIWEKNFSFLPIGQYNPQWGVLNFIKAAPDFLLVINELKTNSPSLAQMDWAKIHFIKVDESGNEIVHEIFQDGQYCLGGFAGIILPDGGLLFSYYESILGGDPPNGDYFMPRPVIARLDNNFNLVWKQVIRELYGTDWGYYANMHECQIVDDSLFVGAFNHVEEIEFNVAYKTRLRLSQYNLNGVNKWNRDFAYFPTDDFNDPEYGIYDLELTTDGGYIMLGEVYHYDSLNVGAPGQYGYVLKTNCLGFLGNPIAEFSYSSNTSEVIFINESIQAGSYTWIFGNGDTLNTDEYIDTVVYNYLMNGDYSVQLIAHGCNGISDTISKTINVNGISTGYAGDGTLLTLFPNPISSGESLAFYVGKIPEGNSTIEIVNEIGAIVFKGVILGGETTYIVPVKFAAGVYFVSLLQNGKRLEVEKLVVR